MPENLTRREFMKDLGKLGAAAALAPRIDFGEQMSDQAYGIKRPGFVKTVDKPTIEIEWKNINRFDERNTVRRGFAKYVSQENIDKLAATQKANTSKWLQENKPGYTLKDVAAAAGANSGRTALSFMPNIEGQGPAKLGVAKWTGTPEEAASMLTAAMRHFGAATVGFVALEPETTEKLIYHTDPDGKQVVLSSTDEVPFEDDNQRVIHKTARWVISYSVQMSEETMARAPTILGGLSANLAYTRFQNIQARTQAFLWGLGYYGLGESSINATGISTAFGTLSGLGEMSRLNRLITPEYGPMVRVFKMVTDLPLAPTKPIDAGLMAFCADCTKCADLCPSKALSFGKEPTWEVRGGWNNPGKKAYYEDAPRCRSYWYQVGTGCGICFAVCPFASKNLASFNRVRNYMTATMPFMNTTFKKLDDLLYTPVDELGAPQKDPELWWKLNQPEYGMDSMKTVRETS